MWKLDVDSGDELASKLLSFSWSDEFDKSDILKKAFSLEKKKEMNKCSNEKLDQ